MSLIFFLFFCRGFGKQGYQCQGESSFPFVCYVEFPIPDFCLLCVALVPVSCCSDSVAYTSIVNGSMLCMPLIRIQNPYNRGPDLRNNITMDPDPGSHITMDPNSGSHIIINTDTQECGSIVLKKGKVIKCNCQC
jgi:hypothetical protein